VVRTCSAEETVTTISDTPNQVVKILTLWRGLLDNDTDNLSVVNDDSTSLESGSTKEIMSVKDEAGSGAESTSVVTNYKVSSGPIDS
jgi:hypothetical protein